jgi:DNA-binding Lrp family transcriptional regulator
MKFIRLPRFKRATAVSPLQLTERDREIIRLIHQHRFLRSSHIKSLMNSSPQQILRRLQLLYHHRYLERPRAQIDYYRQGGSRAIVYGLGSKGSALLKRSFRLPGHALDWGGKNRVAGRQFLEHTLLVSDVMVAMELACRNKGEMRLLSGDSIPLPNQTRQKRQPFQWRVNVSSRGRIGLIPDRVFALEWGDHRAYFFLEADRGTMPIIRENISQSSFHRKLLAYEATWTQNLHRTRFGFNRFRVLTVTAGVNRAQHLAEAAGRLEKGRGLFLFADAHSLLTKTPFSPIWKTAFSKEQTSLLN